MWQKHIANGALSIDGSLRAYQGASYSPEKRNKISYISIFNDEDTYKISIGFTQVDTDDIKASLNSYVTQDYKLDFMLEPLIVILKTLPTEKPKVLNFLNWLKTVEDPGEELCRDILIKLKFIPSREEISTELSATLEEKGFEAALCKANMQYASLPDTAILILADILFERGEYEQAFTCYEKISKNNTDFYQKARYQLGSIIFNQTSSDSYSSIRDHAHTALTYFIEAGDYQDARGLRVKTFTCLCYGSYDLRYSNIDTALIESTPRENLFKMAELIYSVQQKCDQLSKENTQLRAQLQLKMPKTTPEYTPKLFKK